MADPDYVKSPGIKLLGNKYITKRRRLLEQNKILDNPSHGQPSGWDKDLQHSNIGYEENRKYCYNIKKIKVVFSTTFIILVLLTILYF